MIFRFVALVFGYHAVVSEYHNFPILDNQQMNKNETK